MVPFFCNDTASAEICSLSLRDALPICDRCRSLLAVSEAIVSHRDLAALFHELAGRLRPFVRFDYLAVLLHEAASNTLHLHVVEPPGPTPVTLPVGEVPAGLVFESQQPLILSSVAEYERWPRLQELARLYGIQSACWLSLATARRQLGTLSFACK